MISQESTSTSSQNEKENNATLNSSSQKETKETSTSIETNPTEETTVGTITKKSLMSNATGLSNHLINSKGKVDKNLKLNKKNLKKHT